MLPSPPNSTELKGNHNNSPTPEFELPESMMDSVGKKPHRKAPRRNHSEIERRRRERLNLKYNELRELVPACRAFRFARRGGDAGLHKLDILTEAVKYIEELEAKLAQQHEQPMMSSGPLYSLVEAASKSAIIPAVASAPLPPQSHSPSQAAMSEGTGSKHNISYLMN